VVQIDESEYIVKFHCRINVLNY